MPRQRVFATKHQPAAPDPCFPIMLVYLTEIFDRILGGTIDGDTAADPFAALFSEMTLVVSRQIGKTVFAGTVVALRAPLGLQCGLGERRRTGVA